MVPTIINPRRACAARVTIIDPPGISGFSHSSVYLLRVRGSKRARGFALQCFLFADVLTSLDLRNRPSASLVCFRVRHKTVQNSRAHDPLTVAIVVLPITTCTN